MTVEGFAVGEAHGPSALCFEREAGLSDADGFGVVQGERHHGGHLNQHQIKLADAPCPLQAENDTIALVQQEKSTSGKGNHPSEVLFTSLVWAHRLVYDLKMPVKSRDPCSTRTICTSSEVSRKKIK